MKNIKRRAVFAAIIILMQVSTLIFCFDAIITKDANIVKTLIPLVSVQAIAIVALMLCLAGQSFLLSQRKEGILNHVASVIILCVQGAFFVVGMYQFHRHGMLGNSEIVFFALQLVCLIVLGLAYNLSGDKAWKLLFSLLTVTQWAFVIFASMQYRNEMFSLKRIALTYAFAVALLLSAIWGERRMNLILAALVILAQAVITLLKFYELNRATKVLGVITRLVEKRPLEQILMIVILVLGAMMAVTLLLHLFREYQVIGKLAAVFLTSLILFTASLVGSIELEADKIVVDAKETVDTVEYYVYVDMNAPISSPKDLGDTRIGIHYEHNEREVKEVIEKLNQAAGVSLNFYERDSVSELLSAYDGGYVDAFVLDAGTIDDMDAELEMRGSDRVISEELKIIYTLQLEYKVDENEKAPDIQAGTNIDHNEDLALQPFVVYLSGIDVYGSITTKSRSDVNVLAVVNPRTKEIALITTPRDAYVEIPGKTTTLRDKLTHAGNYGVDYSVATLEQLYGINIDFFIRVNFTSMETIVDLLDGVDVYSHYNFTSRFHGYRFYKGINHMNGSQALAFARERKTVTGGDVTRGKHHLELVKGIFAKATSTSVLVNYQSLLAEIQDNFQTNMSMNQIADLVSMQLKDGAQWHFTSYATTGDYTYAYCASYRASKLCVSILRRDSVYKAADLMARVLNGEKIPDGEVTFEEEQ